MRRRLAAVFVVAAALAGAAFVVRHRRRADGDDAGPAVVPEVGLADGSLLQFTSGAPDGLAAAAAALAEGLAAVAAGEEAP